MNIKDRVTKKLIRWGCGETEEAYWASILMRQDIVYDDENCPTMAVNGRSLFINTEWADKLNDDELTAVLGVHEPLHLWFMHPIRFAEVIRQIKPDNPAQRKSLAELMNIAADLAINSLMVKEGYSLPGNCCVPGVAPFDKLPHGESFMWYFNTLWRENSDGGGGGGDDDGADGEGGDASEGESGEGKGKGKGKGGDLTCNDKPITNDQRKSANEGQCQPVPQETRDGEEETDLKELEQELTDDLLNSARSTDCGNVPQILKGLIKKLTPRAPSVPWERQLREFATKSIPRGESTYARINRRLPYSGTVRMPAEWGVTLEEIVMSVDASGSMSDSDVNKAAHELDGILRQFPKAVVRVIQFDTQISKEDVYTGLDVPISRNWKRKRSGGTDFDAPIEAVKKSKNRVACHIIVTDGYAPFPAKVPCPTMWLITPNGLSEEQMKDQIKVGRTVKMPAVDGED